MAYEDLLERIKNPAPPPAQPEKPTSLGAMFDRMKDPVASYLNESRIKARDWSEVESTLKELTPDVDTEKYRQDYQLGRARQRYKDGYEDIPTYILRRSVPGFSAGFEFGESLRYQRAKSRFNEGKASEKDITDIAAYERLQEIDKERNVGEAVVSGLARIPSILGEGAAAAGILAKPAQVGLRGAGATAPSIFTKAGVRAAAKAAPGEFARETLRTPAMPSMWLASAAKRAEQNGGELYEPKNLGVALAFGALQKAVLGHSMKLGHLAGKGRLGQAAAGAAAGFSEQQLGDVAVSAVDEVLPVAYQTRTRYGVIGNLARGEYEQALKNSATQAVTFGAFAGMNRKPSGPMFDAYAKAVDNLSGQKMQRPAIDGYLHQLGGRLDTAMRAKPDLTAGEARSIFEGMPDGPVRDYALALADTLPDRTWSAPRTVQRGIDAMHQREVAANRRELSAQEAANFKTVDDVVSRIEQEARDVESVDGLLGLLEWSLVRDVADMHTSPRKPADLPPAEQVDALYAKLPAGKDLGVKDLKKMSPVDLRRLQDAGAITITPDRKVRKTEGWRPGDRAIEPPEPPPVSAKPPEPPPEAPGSPVPADRPPEPPPAPRQASMRLGAVETLETGSRLTQEERRVLDDFGAGNVFRVDLVGPDGKSIGDATLAQRARDDGGYDIYAHWLGASGMKSGEGRGKHPFGAREIRSLAEQIAREIPDAKFLKFMAGEGRIRPGEQRVIDLDRFRGERPREATEPAAAAGEPVPKLGSRSETIERLAAKARERAKTTKAKPPSKATGRSVDPTKPTEEEAEEQRLSDELRGLEERQRAERERRGLPADWGMYKEPKKGKFSKKGTEYAQTLLGEIARRRRAGLPIEGNTIEVKIARSQEAEAARLEEMRRGPKRQAVKTQAQASQEMLDRRAAMRRMGVRPAAAEAQAFLKATDTRQLDPNRPEPRLEDVVRPAESDPANIETGIGSEPLLGDSLLEPGEKAARDAMFAAEDAAKTPEPTGDDLRARAEAQRREFVERNRKAREEREKAAKEAEKQRKLGIYKQRVANLKQRQMKAGTLIEKIRKSGGVSKESYASLGLDVKAAMENPGVKPIFYDEKGFVSTRNIEDLIPELIRSGDLVETPGEHIHDTLRRKLEGGTDVRSQEGVESREGQAEISKGVEEHYRDVEGAEWERMSPEERAAQKRAYEEAEKRRASQTADDFWDDMSEGGNRLGITPPVYVLRNWGVVGSIAKAARKWLTSAGDLPKFDFREKIAHDGRVAAYAQDVANTEKDLNRVLGKYDYLSDHQRERLDDALRGDQNAMALLQRDKPEVVPIIREMRRQVDALSAALIQNGAVQGKLVATVAGNMGVYLHRRYRVFEDPAWAAKVDPAVMNRFKSWLWSELANKAQGPIDPDLVEGMTKALLTNGTAAENPIAFLSRSKLGAKELGVLQRRKDVPAELRALWGEYKDPLVNYTHSVHRMAHLLSNHVFLAKVAANGRGRHFFSQDELGEFQRLYPGEDPVQITDDAAKDKAPITAPMGPLAGLYTTKAIKKAYEEVYKKQDLPGWLRTYMKFLAVPKYGKTVLNLPAGPMRNFAGNFGFAVANGHFRLGNAMAAFKALRDDSPQGRAYYRELVERGLANESLEANEFRATVKDVLGARDLTQLAAQLGQRYERMALAIGKNTLEMSQKLYQAADTVWKVYAFENEKSRYREAKPNWTDEQVAAHAAEVVRNTYPTYSMIPKAGQALRRMPLVAPFASFPAEVVRTSYHTIRQAVRELKDPDTRAIGWTRLAGSGIAATMSAAASAATLALVGMDRDDEVALRRFLPSWSRDHPLAHMGRDAKGNPLYVDMGVTDPHAFLAEPVYAAMNADDPEEAAMRAALAVGKPFFAEELLTERLLDVVRNERREGGQVWNEQLSPLSKLGSGMRHVGGAFVPGGVTAARRLGMGVAGVPEQKTGRVYDPAHEAAALSGQRISPVDLGRSLEYKGRTFQTGKIEAARIATEMQRARGLVSDKELTDAYERSEAARRKLFEELRLDVLAAERLGMERREIIKSLKAGGVSEDDALHLIRGRYVPRRPELVPLPDKPEAIRRLQSLRQGLRR